MTAKVKPIRPASVSAETRANYEETMDGIAIANELPSRHGHHVECWEKLFAGMCSLKHEQPATFFAYFGGDECARRPFMAHVRRTVGLKEGSDAVGEKVG